MAATLFVQILRHWAEDRMVGLVPLVLLCAWLCWRICKFTVLPALRPDEPKELPYLIPSHTVSFFRDIEGTINYARKYFKNTREPFSVTVGGKPIYVLISASDIHAAQKATDDFNHDLSTVDFMSRFGVTESALKVLFEDPSPSILESKELEPNPSRKHMTHLGAAFLVTQLQPGKRLEDVQSIALDLISQRLAWEHIPTGFTPFSRTALTQRRTSLSHWISRILVESNTTAIFGPALLQTDPTIVSTFLRFDEKIWKLLYSVPSPWSNDMLALKKKLHCTIMKYLDMPKEERKGEAWFIRTYESEMRVRGIATHDIASNLAMVLWVANTNTWRLCFWTLAYILQNPATQALVTREVVSATQEYPELLSLPAAISRCKHLSATYHEVLRLVNSPISLRHITRPTRTATHKLLRPGTQVMLAHRQLLRDEAVFGSSTDSFNPERFLKNEELAKNRSFTPFGGGTRLCPGRFLAKGEVLAFIGLVISKFELHVPAGQKFPRADLKNGAGMGILAPIKGDNFVVDITSRARGKELD